jgi:hypothetical protein
MFATDVAAPLLSSVHLHICSRHIALQVGALRGVVRDGRHNAPNDMTLLPRFC